MEAYVNKFRKSVQGYTIAQVKIIGEKEYAVRIGKEIVLRSLTFLRIFSPANLHPKLTENFNILGTERKDKVTCFTFDENEIGSAVEYFERSFKVRTLTTQDLEEINRLGLTTLNRILVKPKKSGFEEKVLDALGLYSKSTLLSEPQDKLVYMLSAIESILLKNISEPIQKNIGERMAMLIGKTYDERKAIINDVDNIYRIRSRFLHHGYTIDELELLARFMKSVWKFVITLIGKVEEFKTKEEFIEHLEKMKLS